MKRQKKQRQMVRQGDVLVMVADQLPAGAKELPREDGRVVLAHGEATGHAHAILAPTAMLYAHEENGSGGAVPRRYLAVTGGETSLGVLDPALLVLDARGGRIAPLQPGVALQHEEHAPIRLPPGVHEVRRQREYSPEEIRVVAD